MVFRPDWSIGRSAQAPLGLTYMIRSGCLVAAVSFLMLGPVRPSAAADVALASPDQIREIHVAHSDSTLGTLRALSWNIDRGTDLAEIASELKTQRPDLLLLQEVDWNTRRTGGADVAGELAKRLSMNGVFAIEFEELGQEGSGVKAYTGQATLSRVPIAASRVLRFQHQSKFWQAHSWLPSSVPLLQRRRGQRIALVTQLTFSGHPLVVYNVHLESRSYGRIQMEQINEILVDTQQYPANTSILLAGDLNTKYLPSLYLKKLQRAGFRSCLGDKIQRTHTIAMALDWIFAKGDIVAAEGVVRKDLKGSDHYPIYADLQQK